MDRRGDAGQALDETVVIDRRLAGARFSRGLDKGVAGDDEADFAFGQAAIELDLAIGNVPFVVGHVLVRGRADETVGDVERTYLDWREQDAHAPILAESGSREYPALRLDSPLVYCVS